MNDMKKIAETILRVTNAGRPYDDHEWEEMVLKALRDECGESPERLFIWSLAVHWSNDVISWAHTVVNGTVEEDFRSLMS